VNGAVEIETVVRALPANYREADHPPSLAGPQLRRDCGSYRTAAGHG
jgi:hypothetical protein